MLLSLMSAVALFALVTSISPGPSNFMLLASGASFGFVRTIPQILGITAGFCLLLAAVGLGLGAVLLAVPALGLGLKIAGAAYLLWLASRIARARSLGGGDASAARPIGFFASFGFQWINPKAWAVASAAASVHVSAEAPLASVAVIVAVFALINLPAVSIWALAGSGLRRFLDHPVRLRIVNLAMALLLVVSLWPMLH